MPDAKRCRKPKVLKSAHKKFLSNSQLKWLISLIIFILASRLFTLGVYDLTDNTESRYASIAMRMILKNDWITPYYFEAPFWGKPPLSFWATAVSFKLLGISEFSARLPHFLIMLGVIMMAFFNLRKISVDLAILAVFLISSTVAFLILAGTVMTEAVLVFSLTLMMFSFYRIAILKDLSILNGYLFFISLGLSILAKGLVGFVVAAIAIAIFQLKENYKSPNKSNKFPYKFAHKFSDKFFVKDFVGFFDCLLSGFLVGTKSFIRKMPVFSGSILALAIFVPWYVMAEIKTPGFLRYFLIGEHFSRFFVSGWKGDLYGHPHHQPWGMIWIFFAITIVPWGFYVVFYIFGNLAGIFTKKNSLKSAKADLVNLLNPIIEDQKKFYFLCWTISPLLLFTFTSNIIIPYATLAAIPFCILFALILLTTDKEKNLSKKNWLMLRNYGALTVFLILSFFIKKDLFGKFSDKSVIEKFLKSGKTNLASYGYVPRYSTEFYARDKIKLLKNEQDLKNCQDCFILIDQPKNDPKLIQLEKTTKFHNSQLLNLSKI